MVLWRISRHRDLNGLGGLWVNGRWHHAGQPVVYLSDSPASALLEVCVHTAAHDVPPDFTLLRVEGPEAAVEAVAPERMPSKWQQNEGATRDIGTEWLRSRRSVLLKVPSAIVPETVNYLFNPLHRGAETFRIAATYAWPADPRLRGWGVG